MVDPSSLLGLIVDSRYRLATVVGTGSYGWVYAADETAVGEVIGQVAVKLLRPPDVDARKAVIREVQAMRQLTHPNLLTCYAAGQVSDGLASGCLYIATELASETLDARLRQPSRMALDEVREVAEHMASALAYLCERGAVHRDVKPANILRVGNVWKLGDFGLVRGFAGTAMQASGRKGTVLYMSPEAMQGETGPFVDVWALGAVIQECLTGALPYSGNSDTEIIAAALTRDPAISSDLSEPFASIVRSCLVKDRKRRWTAKQVGDDLRGSGSPPPPPVARPPEGAGAATPSPRVVVPASAGTPRFGEVRINPKDGAEMVYVPAGEFIMGSEDYSDEQPQRKVYLDAYWMYKHEVTVAQYRRFCSATGRKMPDPPAWGWKDDHPVVSVSWHDAKAYADWAGMQLPTEAQWEKAARGTDGRVYPWGNAWDPGKCRCSRDSWGDARSTSPVGSYPAGASPYGCVDMAGNVWEWCADWYDDGYYAKAPDRNPAGPSSGTVRVLRGGSWYSISPDFLRASFRDDYTPDVRIVFNGFRCSPGRI